MAKTSCLVTVFENPLKSLNFYARYVFKSPKDSFGWTQSMKACISGDNNVEK